MFERRGVIITKASQDLTVDAAEEDAIEFGAEEVKVMSSYESKHYGTIKCLDAFIYS